MDVFILSAVRTPIGKFLGEFAELPAPRLGSVALAEALTRANVQPDQIDEAIFGNVLQAGLGQNPARQAALLAVLPNTIAAYTVNKVCGSGLKAAMLAAQAIRAGDAEIIVAGGMESMSRAPHIIEGARTGIKYGDGKLVDVLIRDGLWCPFENWPMGDAAEYSWQVFDLKSRPGSLLGAKPQTCRWRMGARRVCRRGCSGHRGHWPESANDFQGRRHSRR